MSRVYPTVWTIAASDSSCGAGIQADLLTFKAWSVNAGCVITAVTAQHDHAISDVFCVNSQSLQQQLQQLHQGLPAEAIKIGLLGNRDHIHSIKDYLRQYTGFSVLDPVIQSSSHGRLLKTEASDLLSLLPYVTLITPNISEAEVLTGLSIQTHTEMEHAAHRLLEQGARHVLIKGGHLLGKQCIDYFCSQDHAFYLSTDRIEHVEARGTGCTLSSAIAAAIAKGHDLENALCAAKMYVSGALRAANQQKRLEHFFSPPLPADLPKKNASPLDGQTPFPELENTLGIYPIVDHVNWIEKLLDLGVKTLQLRIKEPASSHSIRDQIKHSIALAKSYGCQLFINDHWRTAIEYGAYGVHLGQSDLQTADLQAIRSAGLRLGISTHCHAEVATAHYYQPSYIAIGPIFPTQSKIMPFSPQGIENLRYWRRLLNYPIVAIGGIQRDNIASVKACDVEGIAMISAITASSQLEQDVNYFLSLYSQ